MIETLVPRATLRKFTHDENVLESILVTPFGIMMFVRLEQWAKAELPIAVRLLPRLTRVKLLQLAKTPLPMFVTLSGSTTSVRPEHPRNANAPIVNTFVPKATLVIWLQL